MKLVSNELRERINEAMGVFLRFDCQTHMDVLMHAFNFLYSAGDKSVTSVTVSETGLILDNGLSLSWKDTIGSLGVDVSVLDHASKFGSLFSTEKLSNESTIWTYANGIMKQLHDLFSWYIRIYGLGTRDHVLNESKNNVKEHIRTLFYVDVAIARFKKQEFGWHMSFHESINAKLGSTSWIEAPKNNTEVQTVRSVTLGTGVEISAETINKALSFESKLSPKGLLDDSLYGLMNILLLRQGYTNQYRFSIVSRGENTKLVFTPKNQDILNETAHLIQYPGNYKDVQDYVNTKCFTGVPRILSKNPTQPKLAKLQEIVTKFVDICASLKKVLQTWRMQDEVFIESNIQLQKIMLIKFLYTENIRHLLQKKEYTDFIPEPLGSGDVKTFWFPAKPLKEVSTDVLCTLSSEVCIKIAMLVQHDHEDGGVHKLLEMCDILIGGGLIKAATYWINSVREEEIGQRLQREGEPLKKKDILGMFYVLAIYSYIMDRFEYNEEEVALVISSVSEHLRFLVGVIKKKRENFLQFLKEDGFAVRAVYTILVRVALVFEQSLSKMPGLWTLFSIMQPRTISDIVFYPFSKLQNRDKPLAIKTVVENTGLEPFIKDEKIIFKGGYTARNIGEFLANEFLRPGDREVIVCPGHK